jgi:hypothetical protein
MPREYVLTAPTPDFDKEPIFEGLPGVPATTFQLIQAFRWYNANESDTKAAEYLGTDLMTAKRFMTLAWVTRLLTRGFTLPDKENVSYLQQKLAFEEYVKAHDIEKSEAPKVDVQALTKDRALLLLGNIETKMDELIHSKEAFNWYEFLNTLGIKPAHVSYIIAEIDVLKKGSEYPDRFDPIVADLQRISKNTVGARKTRQSKVLKSEKIIGSLKFLKDSPEFKLKSIDPEKIIGAKGLWIFNTQYKSVTYFVADGPSGLSINGTTLKGFNPDLSINKTLRKPEEVLPVILDKTSKQALKVVTELTTKPYKPNGRINENMVLLKVE